MIEKIQAAVHSMFSESHDVLDMQSISGGSISDAFRILVRDDAGKQQTLFAKGNDESFLDNFKCESDGLTQLERTGTIRVPKVVVVAQAVGQAWLVTEWIDSGIRSDGFFARFGQQLANLHRATQGDQVGWHQNNYLGAAVQSNEPCTSWSEFVAVHRIGCQLRWAERQSLSDARLTRDCQKIIDQIETLLSGRDETTSLLHGDLWSGNYLCDTLGQPAIIDPAVYHGCREAEFGMLKLFGSCPSEFYDAYQQTWPMPDGWQRRVDVYVLYHLLNHLNLFGSGYLGQCKSLAAAILRR